MKKTLIVTMALMMALLILCTACGGSNTEEPAASPTEAPVATDLPTVTAPAQEQSDDSGTVSANANDTSAAATHMDRETWLASLSEDQRKVEEELIGSSVDELYAAIGEPISATYGASCLVEGGKDGMLVYDGFTVSTTLFPNGSEMVMGTSN